MQLSEFAHPEGSPAASPDAKRDEEIRLSSEETRRKLAQAADVGNLEYGERPGYNGSTEANATHDFGPDN